MATIRAPSIKSNKCMNGLTPVLRDSSQLCKMLIMSYLEQGRVVYVERSAELNLAAMALDGVTTADVIFTQIRQMEYLVQVKMVAAKKAARRPLDGHIVIAVSEISSHCICKIIGVCKSISY